MSLASPSPTYLLLQMLLAALIVVILCSQYGAATIIAKSTVNECINFGEPELLNKKGDLCGKKLVIALTVSGNEVNFELIFLDVCLTYRCGIDTFNRERLNIWRQTLQKLQTALQISLKIYSLKIR